MHGGTLVGKAGTWCEASGKYAVPTRYGTSLSIAGSRVRFGSEAVIDLRGEFDPAPAIDRAGNAGYQLTGTSLTPTIQTFAPASGRAASGHGRHAIDISDVLLAYSQLALGLAGFSAILVALSGSPSQWTPVDAFRIKNMLAFSFAGVFLALTPVLLTFFAVPEPELWRASLAVLAVTTLGGALFALSGIRRLTMSDRSVLSKPLIIVVLSLLTAAALVEAIAALTSWDSASGVFFAGLLALLAMSVYLVVRFLFARPQG